MASFWQQYSALMHKNFILRLRHPIMLLFELALPLSVFILFVWIRGEMNEPSVTPRQEKTSAAPLPSFGSFLEPLEKPTWSLLKCFNDNFSNDGRPPRYRIGVYTPIGEDNNNCDYENDSYCWYAAGIASPFMYCNSVLCGGHGENATSYCEAKDVVISAKTEDDPAAAEFAEQLRSHILETYVDDMNTEANFTVQLLTSNQEVNDQVASPSYGNPSRESNHFGVGIVVNGGFPKVDFTIRMNYTVPTPYGNSDRGSDNPAMPTTSEHFLPPMQSEDGVSDYCGGSYGPMRGCAGLYLDSGELSIQRMVQDFVVNTTLSGSGKESGCENNKVQEKNTDFYDCKNFPMDSYTDIYMATFPSEKFASDGFWGQLNGMFGYMVVVSFLLPVSNTVRALVVEKELKIKEGMKMMSLTTAAHLTSWFTHFGWTYYLISVLIAFFAKDLFVFSDVSLIFTYFFLFLNATLAFCFWMSTLFSRSKTSAIVSGMFFLFGAMLRDIFPNRTFLVSCALSLHPVAALCFGLDAFVEYEDTNQGVTTLTYSSTSYSEGFTFRTTLVMLAVDIPLFAFLHFYFERVMPSEFGTSKHPLFLFSPTFWFPSLKTKVRARLGGVSSSESQVDPSDDCVNVEKVSQEVESSLNAGEGVHIFNLQKSFNTVNGVKHAVDHLNLKMYHNQITCLLGHNGAGKTTTIAMMTGLIPVTGGRCTINGKNVETEMEEIRKDMGVCPQHDILFPELTVREHLSMYAKFKGVPRRQVAAEVEKIIVDVGLTEKKNEFSKNLSGGMKRKLSLGIAVIGGSSVLLLDEPTSGMDPYSRRFTWNVIRKYRENRTIILTTHFMDEADLLGDRIAIMSAGKLRCAGSSLFLKQVYGVGYNLTLERGQKANTTKLEEFVTSRVSEAQVLSKVGTELSFQLPLDSSPCFKSLFNSLEKHKESLGVVNFGVGVTTLEEVFLKVARGHDDDKKAVVESTNSLKSQRSESIISRSNSGEFSPPKSPQHGKTSNDCFYFGRHMSALLHKRLVYMKRDKKMWFFGFFLPTLLVFVGLLGTKLGSAWVDPGEITLSSDVFNTELGETPIPYNSDGANFTCFPVFWQWSQIESRYQCPLPEDHLAWDEDCCTPSVSVDGFMENSYEGGVGVPIEPVFSDLSTPTNVEQLSTWLLNSTDSLQASRYAALQFESVPKAGTLYPYPKVLMMTNWTAYHATPIYLAELYNAVLDNLVAGGGNGNNDDVSITVRLQPFGRTVSEANTTEVFSSFGAILLILMAFPFIPSQFIAFVIREKENKAKHIQFVSGVAPHSYWLATWLFDVASFQVPCWCCIAMFHAFDIDTLTNDENFEGICLILFLYGTSMSGFCYVMSYFFKSHSFAQNFVIFFSFLTGFIMAMISIFLSFVPELHVWNDYVTIIGRFIPSFNLGHGLLSVNFSPIITALDFAQEANDAKEAGLPPPDYPETNFKATDDRIAGLDIVAMLYGSCAYVVAAIAMDYFLATPALYGWVLASIYGGKNKGENPSEDEDVREEEVRVKRVIEHKRPKGDEEDGDGDREEDAILVDNLTKIYRGGKKAVRGFSLGVPYGQCFGLLGINGAGKTTTLSILSGEFPATSGRAYLAGLDVFRDANSVRRLMGYCPQFDALFENLTGREHLYMYGRIKGISEAEIKEVVEKQIEKMDLTDHASRLAGGYSGGNKRKLSVACAMIGNPSIVILDEPSTGMDPVARRFMWNKISDICNEGRTSVILTTHSMEECEALCERIGIMVGGRFRCLGSAQHLKSKFGHGYQIEFVFNVPKEERVNEILEKLKGNVLAEGDAKEGIGTEETKVSTAEMCKMTPQFEEGIRREGLDEQTLSDFASWLATEASFNKLNEFMKERFVGVECREKQGSKVRYEVEKVEGVTLGDMFGILEESKEELNLMEYALSQTSLEQIFNGFASKQQEETGKVKGLLAVPKVGGVGGLAPAAGEFEMKGGII